MRVLVVGAHPDDIEPQMGGTIAKLTQKGHEVLILQVTKTGDHIADIRIKESIVAASILKASIKHLNFNQDTFGLQRKVIQSIDQVIEEFKPDEIYTCWEHDSHQDHRIVYEAVIAASRKNTANLYCFEPILPGGITPYGFESNYYVDISDTIQKKMESMIAYKSQIEKYGEDWIHAIYARAKIRGFQIHVPYAEAFKIIKLIGKI
ncbi:PIG-L deacetylase family protein [Inediibacterium massiliense]|uniref:PIG-L deacetylase family protein n=1 Tax=Inediibacterium massiliense TaxID=1658111 RepID=UPI0006B495E1|nr:PIG-L deacetylase family protein [Inediibacterium massiliense]